MSLRLWTAPRIGRHAVGVLSLVAATASAQSPTPGSVAPEIDLPALSGGRVKLSAYRGHPVIVTFWGTWCPPCRDEFPELVAAAARHRDAKLVVLAVNQRDQELTTEQVKEFVTRYAANFPVALDVRGRSRRSFRLVGLPTTVFIDSAGIIRVVHPGPLSREQLDKALESIVPGVIQAAR